MFEKPVKLTASQSDSLAMQYYSIGDYSSALGQNLITRDLIGKDTPEILKNSAACYSKMFKPKQAAYCFEKYLKLTKSCAVEDYTTLASYYSQSGDLDEARELLLKCPETSFQLQHDLVMHSLRREEYKQGFEAFDLAKRTYNVLWIGEKKWSSLPDCPRWDGESLSGKTVCLVGECGLGDEIAFSRWIPSLLKQAKSVHYLTDNTLEDVFVRNFLGLLKWNPKKKYDFWLPSMSLPLVTGEYQPCSKPYLTACSKHVEKWQGKLPMKSGFFSFNWTGSSNFSQNSFRDVPIDYLLSKLKRSVNVNVCLETDYNPSGMMDLRKDIKTWEDTLAVLALSNGVFSSCSSVAHAAGAIGKKAHVYTRPDDYFTWSSTESGAKSKWYDSVTVWRTDKIGKWKEVIDASVRSLA